MVTLETNMGTIKIELDHSAAPKTCENFEKYVTDGHFNGTIFHATTNHATSTYWIFRANNTKKSVNKPILLTTDDDDGVYVVICCWK